MYNNSENYSNETTIKNSKIIITFYLQNQAMVNKKKLSYCCTMFKKGTSFSGSGFLRLVIMVPLALSRLWAMMPFKTPSPRSFRGMDALSASQ